MYNSRDYKGVGVEDNTQKPASLFPNDDEAVLGRQNQPQASIQINQKSTEPETIYLMEFSTDLLSYWQADCVTDIFRQASVYKAKAMVLIFSLFDVASAQEVPFGIQQYAQCILYELTSLVVSSFVFHSSLMIAKVRLL